MHVESMFLCDGRLICLHKTRGKYIFARLITKKQPLLQSTENLFFFWGQVAKPELEKQSRF